MKILKPFAVVASADKLRKQLNNLLVDNGRMVVTDSYMLLDFPLPKGFIADSLAYVPAEHLKALADAELIAIEGQVLTAGAKGVHSTISLPVPESIAFPGVRIVLDEYKDKKGTEVALSVTYLKRILAAYEAEKLDRVTVKIFDNVSPVVFSGAGDRKALLMPIRN